MFFDFQEFLTRRVADVTLRYQQAGFFPTASIRVFDKEKTLAAVQVGQAKEDSVFDVASLSKIATATQVLMLIDDKRLSLKAPIGDYLDEISGDPYLRERMKDVTLEKLLTHTSTLVDWYPFYSRRGEDFYAVLSYALAHTEPVVGMKYSDLNFMLLGKLLEKVNGMTLEKCLQEKLVKPLKLGKMAYHPPKEWDIIPSCYDNAIEMEMCRERNISFDGFRPLGQAVQGTVNDGNAHYFFDDAAGHAGVFAQPEAYEKLCRFYMNTDSPLLLRAQQEQPFSPSRGLGLETGAAYPYGCGHTGFTGTCIYFSREKNIGVVSFTNRLFYKSGNPNATNIYRRALHESVLTVRELMNAL